MTMQLTKYLGLLRDAEAALSRAFEQVAAQHGDEPDVEHLCSVLSRQAGAHVKALDPVVARYGEQDDSEAERLAAAEFNGSRGGGAGLLRDLHDLYTLASFVDITWTVIGQAAQGVRDAELLDIVRASEQETTQQLTWLRTRIKQAAPQALIIAP